MILSYGPKRADMIFMLLFVSGMFSIGVLMVCSTESLFEKMIGALFCVISCLVAEQQANWTHLFLKDRQLLVKRGPLPSFYRWKPIPLEDIESIHVAYVRQSKQEFYAVLLRTPDSRVESIFRGNDQQHAVEAAQYIADQINQIAPVLAPQTRVSGRSYYSETHYAWVRQADD